MARQFFPSEEPIGKHLICEYTPDHPLEVIGVVRDIQEQSIDAGTKSAAYLSYEQAPDSGFFLTVRTSSDEKSVLLPLAKLVHHLSPDIIVDKPESMVERINETPASYLHRSAAWLSVAFAGVAALLTTTGLFGVISYAVAQRNREIALRLALGASLHSIHQLVYSDGCKPVVLGAAAGLLLSLPITSLLRSMLFGVSPWDLWTILDVFAGVMISAVAACFVPALRASRVSPMDVLRAE